MFRRIFLSSVVFSLLSIPGVFAGDEGKPPVKPKPAVSAVVGTGSESEEGITESGPDTPDSADQSGSTDSSDQGEKEKERQKAVDDVNAFLIESYKIKLDRALSDVYASVRSASKDDPAIQVVLLRRILSEVETKVSALSDRPVSPNRKKILLAVFAYMKGSVEGKITALEGK